MPGMQKEEYPQEQPKKEYKPKPQHFQPKGHSSKPVVVYRKKEVKQPA